tara:strand:+ start:790 stop:1212 length:423 start_codon:yes stop_codon:yes gene_type:complete
MIVPVPDKTYKIEAANKKCVRISECYEHDNGDEIWLERVYRNGVFFITLQDWDECDRLQAAILALGGKDILIDEFSEWEFDSVYDLCSEDSMGDTEKMYEALDTDDWDDEEEWLENNDFHITKSFYEIQDGIILSDVEHS